LSLLYVQDDVYRLSLYPLAELRFWFGDHCNLSSMKNRDQLDDNRPHAKRSSFSTHNGLTSSMWNYSDL